MRSRIAPLLVGATCLFRFEGALADGLQPPLLDPTLAKPVEQKSATAISGVLFTDVLLMSGYDVGGEVRGVEPSLAINPLNPNEIVLTSFSGSGWSSGDDSTLFYSADGGTSWSLLTVVPPPTGTTTNVNCPCDQTVDWGRDGTLYATFLHLNTGGSEQTVYSAQTPTPSLAGSWVYRTNAGVAQETNLPSLSFVDQPWLSTGPISETQPQSNVCVAYDDIDPVLNTLQTRAADSPAAQPMDFVRHQPTNSDGQQFSDGMNPGHRIAIGPTGVIFNVFQRFVADAGGGVKQLTYLITASADGGQTWSVANSDHPSGAKILAANVYSFQGYGSKVGGVNALLGGVTAISVDPATGTAWVVYGTRPGPTSHDRLLLVPVTYSSGSLIVGTATVITSGPAFDHYLPAVAVLPNGEVGVLYVLYNPTTSSFTWTLRRTGAGPVTWGPFTSPFADNGDPRQRILGDYVQLKAVGCEFYGTFPARGEGTNSVNSIDPFFVRAPASMPCQPPNINQLDPSEACVSDPPFLLSVLGNAFLRGATLRVTNQDRATAYGSDHQLSTAIIASDLSTPGQTISALNPAPAGGLSNAAFLPIDAPAGSPGNSVRVLKASFNNAVVFWDQPSGARRFNVKRCTATAGPCTPVTIAIPSSPAYFDPILDDPNLYWYLIESDNACGAVP